MTVHENCLAMISRLTLLVAISVSPAWGDDDVSVQLTEGEDGYHVEGTFTVNAARPTVWHVLADYDQIGQFISTIESSQVVERGHDHILVEQEARVGALWFFKRSVRLRLFVRERPDTTVEFQDVLQKDFTTYVGKWEILSRDEGVEVRYTLTAKPKFRAPGFVARGAILGQVRDLLQEVRAQIELEKQRNAKNSVSAKSAANVSEERK